MSYEINKRNSIRSGMIKPGPLLKTQLVTLAASMRMSGRPEIRKAAEILDEEIARVAQVFQEKIVKEEPVDGSESVTSKVKSRVKSLLPPLADIPGASIMAWLTKAKDTFPTKSMDDESRGSVLFMVYTAELGDIVDVIAEDESGECEPTIMWLRMQMVLDIGRRRMEETRADAALFDVFAVVALHRDQIALFGRKLEHVKTSERSGRTLARALRAKMLEASDSAKDEALRLFIEIKMEGNIDGYFSQFSSIVSRLDDCGEPPARSLQISRFIAGLSLPFRDDDGNLKEIVYTAKEKTRNDSLDKFFNELRGLAATRGMLQSVLKKVAAVSSTEKKFRRRGKGEKRKGKCYICKKQGHYAHECRDVECYKCGKKGHMKSKCPENKSSTKDDKPTAGPSGVESSSH